jgi:hypothetical protein
VKSICNFGYARTKKGGAHFPDVKGLLRYVQYRDDRDDHIPSGGGPDRWVDGGLGDSYPFILARLDRLSAGNPHAYCFAVVVSPDPEAIADVEGDPQARFVEAVKASMVEWQTWRDEHDKPLAGPIEYSFVVHRPERNYGEQMHAHLILAPATENAMNGDLSPLYNNRVHVDAFKEIVYRQLDRAYGLDLAPERPEPGREIKLAGERSGSEIELPRFHDNRTAGEAEQ